MAPSVGFIGLGNVGAKLAGSLLRNGVALTVRDLDRTTAQNHRPVQRPAMASPRCGSRSSWTSS